jgi:hypothetical protein
MSAETNQKSTLYKWTSLTAYEVENKIRTISNDNFEESEINGLFNKMREVNINQKGKLKIRMADVTGMDE